MCFYLICVVVSGVGVGDWVIVLFLLFNVSFVNNVLNVIGLVM